MLLNVQNGYNNRLVQKEQQTDCVFVFLLFSLAICLEGCSEGNGNCSKPGECVWVLIIVKCWNRCWLLEGAHMGTVRAASTLRDLVVPHQNPTSFSSVMSYYHQKHCLLQMASQSGAFHHLKIHIEMYSCLRGERLKCIKSTGFQPVRSHVSLRHSLTSLLPMFPSCQYPLSPTHSPARISQIHTHAHTNTDRHSCCENFLLNPTLPSF